jgi:hypothetical protein
MKTVRRDKLRRLAERGKLVLVSAYSFDDLHGASRDRNVEIPVKMRPANPAECVYDGKTCYIRPDEFEGNCGRAWENPNGTITLYVHSNSNYEFRVLP